MDDGNIISFISSIHDTHQLESTGQSLNAAQFLKVLDAVSQKVLPENTLLPLLVGIPTETFIQIINQASPDQLNLLKLESVTEPIQHHLTSFVNKAEKASEEIANELIKAGKWIQQMDLALVSKKDLDALRTQLRHAKEYYQEMLSVISRALALTWNTNRLDLIDKFTILKEHCLVTLHEFVGSPRNEANPPSALYDQLEKRLATVFDGTESLKDTDPATEALAMFSIWYLKDYWFVGLLPSIHSEEALELNGDDEVAKRDHRQKLFSQVQENLNRLGIGTVGELKKAEIFSAQLLQDYIASHRLPPHALDVNL